jgi:hypothetical protein
VTSEPPYGIFVAWSTGGTAFWVRSKLHFLKYLPAGIIAAGMGQDIRREIIHKQGICKPAKL